MLSRTQSGIAWCPESETDSGFSKVLGIGVSQWWDSGDGGLMGQPSGSHWAHFSVRPAFSFCGRKECLE